MDKELISQNFIEILDSRFKKGLGVNLVVTGNSMSPFLVHKRDIVFLSKIFKEPKKGDIILFKRRNGKCVLHRLKKIKNGGYYFIGDGQNRIEGPINRENLLAICKACVRKGELINEENFIWRFLNMFG